MVYIAPQSPETIPVARKRAFLPGGRENLSGHGIQHRQIDQPVTSGDRGILAQRLVTRGQGYDPRGTGSRRTRFAGPPRHSLCALVNPAEYLSKRS